jgi:long-chain acyl-CoA synthetase
MLLQNSVQFVVALYGIYAANATAVPLDADAASPNIVYQLGGTSASAIVTQARYARVLSEALPQLPDVRLAVVYDDGTEPQDSWPVAVYDWDTMLADAPRHPLYPRPDDLGLIMHTTGTTGKAKGVMLTQGQMVLATQNVINMAEIGEADREVTALPLVRLFGQFHIYCYHQMGGTLIVEPGLRNPIRLLELLCVERATSFPHVPSAFIMLMNRHAEKLRECGRALRYVMLCSMPISVEDLDRLQDHLPNTEIINTYGLSEAIRSTYVNVTRRPDKASSVGHAIPGGRVLICDDDGHEVSSGEQGEIVLQMPHAFRGYWNMPEETALVLRAEGLYTGDAGYMDQDGFLYYIGRYKDFVNVGGRKYHPQEIEDILTELDGVREAVVVPVPDPEELLGEVPFVFVVPARGKTVTEQELKRALLGKVEYYKIPRLFCFTEDVPRTGSGKVRRNVLREEAERILRNKAPGHRNA